MNCAVTTNYCSSTTPILENGVITLTSQVVNANNSYSCDLGYESTGGSINPSTTCMPFNATNGMWSAITYNCTSKNT